MTQKDQQILHIALPSIVSNITVPLLGLIDVAITGHMGSAAYVGAIAVGGMLFNIIYWLFVFLRMGTSGMTSQAFGARDFKEVTGVLQRAVTVALGLSVLLLCLQVPIRELSLYLIQPSEEVADLARTYYNICVWGAPASLLLFVLSGWFLGMQNSKAPMAVAIIQNVSNIIFSLVLVYLLHWKIKGVATGTVMAQYVGLAAALIFLRGYKRLSKYRPKRLGDMRRFFMLNKDIFLRTICLIFVHFYFIAAGARYGDTPLAINALIMQMYLLYSYIMDGFAFAGEALVGKDIGAKNYEALDDTVRRLFGWGTAMMILFTIAYGLFDKDFMALLTDEPTVLEAARHYHWWAILLPLCGLMAFIWDGIYIGATATKGMLTAMATGMVAFFCFYELLSPTLYNHALWIAFNVYIFVRGATQALLWKKTKRGILTTKH
ncbi:MAG: MATE family efflux transporter [Prevotella sp.]|nr:MATE family efflux transporter [Candidatus Prevotella equi]